jgi:hypothetical protein
MKLDEEVPNIGWETDYYKIAIEMASTPLGQSLNRHGDILNAKISSLLTHISVMIATLTFFMTAFGDIKSRDRFTYLLLAEIMLYLVFAIFCLRGVLITNHASFRGCGDKLYKRYASIIRHRRRYYLISLYGTIFVTISFMATLVERTLFS